MRDVPVLNLALQVEAVGFRPFMEGKMGVLITPWFMNLIWLPDGHSDMGAVVNGTTQSLELPAAEVDFLTAEDPAIGAYLTCSLFSPMFEFADMAHARAVAEAILEELFTPKAVIEAVAEAVPAGIMAKLEQPVTRRGFLGALIRPVRQPDEGKS
jgi:[NiFe] hydrogenase assembly HybE family chaperone